MVSRVRRQQENGLTQGDGSLAPEEGWTATIGSASSSGAKDKRGHQAALGRPPLKISRAPTVLPPENTLAALPLPFSGGNWGFCGVWSSTQTGLCPPGERQTGPQPRRNRTVPALPLPAITTSPEASEVPGHLAVGYFLPPQSELLRGLWLEKRCPTVPRPPSVVEGRGTACTYWGLGLIF